MYFECMLKQSNHCNRTIEIDFQELKNCNPNIDIQNFANFRYQGWDLSNNNGETVAWCAKHRSNIRLKRK